MRLFDTGVTYRSKQIGLRDTAGRFIHDLATNGVPMSLASLKAACNNAAGKTALPCPTEIQKRRDPRPFRLIQPIGPVDALA